MYFHSYMTYWYSFQLMHFIMQDYNILKGTSHFYYFHLFIENSLIMSSVDHIDCRYHLKIFLFHFFKFYYMSCNYFWFIFVLLAKVRRQFQYYYFIIFRLFICLYHLAFYLGSLSIFFYFFSFNYKEIYFKIF